MSNYAQKDLNTILESELLGEHLFATAALFSFNPNQRRKWQALEVLESQTKQRLLDYLKNSQQTATSRKLLKLEATISGIALAVLPWKLSMHLLGQGTRPFLETFERLEAQSQQQPQDTAFFKYVVAHEKAIQHFAKLEQSGDSRHSLVPVHALLT